jgi:hypothetical protein
MTKAVKRSARTGTVHKINTSTNDKTTYHNSKTLEGTSMEETPSLPPAIPTPYFKEKALKSLYSNNKSDYFLTAIFIFTLPSSINYSLIFN